MKSEQLSSSIKILLHGFFLISLNLFSLMAAVVTSMLIAYDFSELGRLAIALIINAMIYLLVYKIMKGIQPDIMKVDDFMMLTIVIVTSLALLPAVFYPLHFLTKGEWGTFNNILKFWPFQLLVNGICLVLNYYFLSINRST